MSRDYWHECLSIAANEAGIELTGEQLQELAAAVEGGYENYGQAFYSPPASDRISVIEREWQARIDALQREFDAYVAGSETAMRRALKQPHDAMLEITEDGEVFRHGGRTDQIL